MTIDDAIWTLLGLLMCKEGLTERESMAIRCAINSLQIEKDLRDSLNTQMWNDIERRRKGLELNKGDEVW